MLVHKKKEIIRDYQKKVKELDDDVMRKRNHSLKRIKKQTLNHLVRMGEDEFEALELLKKFNDFQMQCLKCGSEVKCVKC